MEKDRNSKINRIYEKTLFKALLGDLKYELIFNAFQSEKEVSENYNKHFEILQNSSFELEDEIDDNLMFLSKDESLIYLKRLLNKATNAYESAAIMKKYCKEKKLEKVFFLFLDDIKKREDIIGFTHLLYNHKCRISNTVLELVKRKIDLYDNTTQNNTKLKWIGKPSHLGFILGELASLDYIDAPKHKSGEINYTQFAKLIMQTFQTDGKESSLTKYLNLQSEKGEETKRNFTKESFVIPHRKSVS